MMNCVCLLCVFPSKFFYLFVKLEKGKNHRKKNIYLTGHRLFEDIYFMTYIQYKKSRKITICTVGSYSDGIVLFNVQLNVE